MINTKRLGRYHNVPSNKSNNDNSSSQSHFNKLASLYNDNNRKSVVDWDKPLFGHTHTSLQKVLANANKTIEKSTKFINKIKSRQLACANRAKSSINLAIVSANNHYADFGPGTANIFRKMIGLPSINWQEDSKKYDKLVQTENNPAISTEQKSLSDYL